MHARSLFAAALVAAVLIPGVVSGHLNGGKWNWNFVIGCELLPHLRGQTLSVLDIHQFAKIVLWQLKLLFWVVLIIYSGSVNTIELFASDTIKMVWQDR